MIRTTHHLSPAECDALVQANTLLATLTESHCHSCECGLCRSRTLTDVQDEEAYHVPYTPAGTEDN